MAHVATDSYYWYDINGKMCLPYYYTIGDIKINLAKHPFCQSYTNFVMNKNKINNKTKLNKI